MTLTEKPLVNGQPVDDNGAAKADVEDDAAMQVGDDAPEVPQRFLELEARVAALETCVHGRARK